MLIRRSVIALSKLYSLNDPRLAQTMVKGDLVLTESAGIKTRSRSKQSMYTKKPLCFFYIHSSSPPTNERSRSRPVHHCPRNLEDS